jgi:hypothetical protein
MGSIVLNLLHGSVAIPDPLLSCGRHFEHSCTLLLSSQNIVKVTECHVTVRAMLFHGGFCNFLLKHLKWPRMEPRGKLSTWLSVFILFT